MEMRKEAVELKFGVSVIGHGDQRVEVGVFIVNTKVEDSLPGVRETNAEVPCVNLHQQTKIRRIGRRLRCQIFDRALVMGINIAYYVYNANVSYLSPQPPGVTVTSTTAVQCQQQSDDVLMYIWAIFVTVNNRGAVEGLFRYERGRRGRRRTFGAKGSWTPAHARSRKTPPPG